MPNTPVDTDDNDFVLKHRIAGAAFLLFFGALVLPWLLGAPTDAKKIEPANVVQQKPQAEEYVPEDLENEVLTQLKDEAAADEKVYISKVTPAGFTKVSDSDDDKKAQAAKLAKEKAEKEIAAKAAADAANKKAQEKAKELAKSNQDKAELEKQKQAALAKQKADAQAAANKAAEPAKSIKSGWIVQVGVFTDKSGADKMSKSLSEKGFKTSLSTVDTNKGPGTGTRVWLGPYLDRAQATKAKTSLSDKTGTSGFIRAYP